MAFELSKVVASLGEEAIAKAGEPLGLDTDQSNRVARALAAHVGAGDKDSIAKAAADTGIDEEVVTAMSKKLIEVGGEKLLAESGVSAAIDGAKDQAMAAFGNVGGEAAKQAGGFLGKLFGKK